MKTLTFFSLMLCSLGIFAQQPFAPPGAKWYVGAGSTYSVYEVTKDTLINDLWMQKIEVPWYPDVFTFQDDSKVYFWSQNDTSLRLIFDFGVTTGDSVSFQFYRELDPEVYWRGTVTKDSTVVIGTDSLKRITCALAPSDDSLPSACCISYIYLERVGTLFASDLDFDEQTSFTRVGFLPDARISIATGPTEILRCYEDGSLTYKSPRFRATGNNQACDDGVLLNTIPPTEQQVSISPNPTAGPLTLALPPTSLAPNCHGRLLDVQGRQLRHFAFSDSQVELDLRPLPAGIYLIKVFEGSQLLSRQKVVLQH